MQYLLPAAVFLLMISVGMSLRLTGLIANWRSMTRYMWLSLVIATFIVPPGLALLMANLFRLPLGETAGLFLVGVAPGAPLLTRNLARRGFDMHLAASYQVWAALMVPIMIPLLVMAGGKLYGRDIWIPPLPLLKQIIEKQFLPLAVGMVIGWIAPKISQRSQPILNVAGNVVLTVMIVAVLFKMRSELESVSPLAAVAALLLAVGSIAAMRLFPFKTASIRETFAICNANRHVGLALLISGQFLHARHALPVVACYAIAAPLTMFAYIKLGPARKRVVSAESANS